MGTTTPVHMRNIVCIDISWVSFIMLIRSGTDPAAPKHPDVTAIKDAQFFWLAYSIRRIPYTVFIIVYRIP